MEGLRSGSGRVENVKQERLKLARKRNWTKPQQRMVTELAGYNVISWVLKTGDFSVRYDGKTFRYNEKQIKLWLKKLRAEKRKLIAAELNKRPNLPIDYDVNQDGLHERVRQVRLHMRLRATEMAQRLGVTVRSINLWETENGMKHSAAKRNLLAMAFISKINHRWLLTGTPMSEVKRTKPKELI